MKAKENQLNQSVTGNPYYDYLIHEVQVVCNCPTDKAMAIVSYVNSLGSSPIDFIRKLPDYVGNPHPDADEVLQALENIREDHGVQRYGICFPEGYANRKERRRQEKEARRQVRNCCSMGDNPRKVEAVIKGVTADRKQLILSIGNVEMTATRNFTGLFTATDLRSIVGEPDKEVRIPVLSLLTQEVKGFKVPAFAQSDTLKITKL